MAPLFLKILLLYNYCNMEYRKTVNRSQEYIVSYILLATKPLIVRDDGFFSPKRRGFE